LVWEGGRGGGGSGGNTIRGWRNIKTHLSQMFSFFRVRKISFRPLCRLRLANGFRKLFQIGQLAVKSIASSVTVHASRGSLRASSDGTIPKILKTCSGAQYPGTISQFGTAKRMQAGFAIPTINCAFLAGLSAKAMMLRGMSLFTTTKRRIRSGFLRISRAISLRECMSEIAMIRVARPTATSRDFTTVI